MPWIRNEVSHCCFEEDKGQPQLDTPDYRQWDIPFNYFKNIGETDEEENGPEDIPGSSDLPSRHPGCDRNDGNGLHGLNGDRVPVIIPGDDEPDAQKKEDWPYPEGTSGGKREREGKDGPEITNAACQLTDTKPEWGFGILGHDILSVGVLLILRGLPYRFARLQWRDGDSLAHGR